MHCAPEFIAPRHSRPGLTVSSNSASSTSLYDVNCFVSVLALTDRFGTPLITVNSIGRTLTNLTSSTHAEWYQSSHAWIFVSIQNCFELIWLRHFSSWFKSSINSWVFLCLDYPDLTFPSIEKYWIWDHVHGFYFETSFLLYELRRHKFLWIILLGL